ncbi:unnamed protein product [Darwinula stevensoni]|uniref:Gonadal protein gdl n=1 Tax=Darwinula stevensoni TaxID=69355 RepID=A0A7R8X9V8_9CRUS|nr:unnamed protein product [Darwinula stevensoni]CAG0891433.1 unnamed protein product [Darwinula stevensoni]
MEGESQDRLYAIIDQLQNMSRELPLRYQQRVPYELLSSLGQCLLNPTVFEIVQGLREIQQVTEKHLFQQRLQLQNEHRMAKSNLIRKHKEKLQESESVYPHQVPLLTAEYQREMAALEKQNKDDITRFDMKLILQLDQKVSDQQVMMAKAGVPGFHVTNNPTEVRVQMYLLDFILRLAPSKSSSSS